MAKRKKTCSWYGGKTARGYKFKCLEPGKSKYSKPKGSPKSWKMAYGPYRTRKAAVRAVRSVT